MFKKGINFLKISLVVGWIGLGGLGVSTVAMESTHTIKDLGIFEDNLYDLDLVHINARTVPFFDDILKSSKREKILKSLCLVFERIILDYFCTQQERENYRNKHKKDYSLGMEFEEFMFKLNRNRRPAERIIKKEALDFLISSYVHNAKNIKSTAREFVEDRAFRLTFKGDNKGEQGVRIQFSPQLLAEKCDKINVDGTSFLKNTDIFKKAFDSIGHFKKLSFEICDYNSPKNRLILGGVDPVYGSPCRFRNSEITNQCDNLRNRKIVVLEDRMILEEAPNGCCLYPKNKNERLFLEDGKDYLIKVYECFEDGQFGTFLFSTKAKAELVDYLYLDFDEMNKFVHPKGFDVILWFEYYISNAAKLKE